MSARALLLAFRTLINGPAYEPRSRRMPKATVGAMVRKSARASLAVAGVVSTFTSESTRYGRDAP